MSIAIRGVVQGVGFRPHVYRLATELQLNGWVINSSQGVFIEVEGDERELGSFLKRVASEKPPRAIINSLEPRYLETKGFERFEIRESAEKGDKSVLILPDLATCEDCVRELFDPADRRYRYPFINCTNCGPRFSIIESLPYDRPNTTMKAFALCPDCREEYEDPSDRRFHAQPIACPKCGPQLSFHDAHGQKLAEREEALQKSLVALERGEILALKGMGGFQLLLDAGNLEKVSLLRDRKRRGSKPFALMVTDVGMAREMCVLSDQEERLLDSPESPIVLLKTRDELWDHCAPGLGELGIMLPYTPLHHLIMREFNGPLVATSANLSEEPICTENVESIRRLSGIADCYLMHDRPIARHVDDSVTRVLMGREQVLRRARGYAPLPLTISRMIKPSLAVGAHMKNAVALGVGDKLFLSQYIGDLETEESIKAFRKTAVDLPRLYEKTPHIIAHDKHPDYTSTRFAKNLDTKTFAIQHHLAHVYSCMADNDLEPPVLGISWDGVGYGDDGGIWGGECFLVEKSGSRRVASILPFPLVGGDAAAKEPRRSALGMAMAFKVGDPVRQSLLSRMDDVRVWGRVVEIDTVNEDEQPYSTFERRDFKTMLRVADKRINSPDTSSMGRLFDGVSSLLGIRHINDFEGQAAMLLEGVAKRSECESGYSFDWFRESDEEDLWLLDWRSAVKEVLSDLASDVDVPDIARKFHQMLVEAIVEMVEKFPFERVVLTGGCFQNRLLSELSISRLREAGKRVFWHQRIPPNDGGIAIGQLYGLALENGLLGS